ENKVVTLFTFGEILLGVINNVICADGSDHLHISRTAYAGHICAEPLGNLHSERTHASRRTVNQDLLPRLNPSLVAKTLQCGQPRHGYRTRLLKRHVIRLHHQCGLRCTRILGKGPLARAKHCVAWFELLDFPANRFNLASHITPGSPGLSDLWFAQPEQYAEDVRRAS